MTCIHSVIVAAILPPSTHCLPPIHPLPTLWQPLMLSFSFHSHALFQNVIELEPQSICFHSVIGIYVFSMSFHSSTAHLFLVLNNIPLSEWTSLFIHSPTEVNLGCLQVLETLNKGLFFLLQKLRNNVAHQCARGTLPGPCQCQGPCQQKFSMSGSKMS